MLGRRSLLVGGKVRQRKVSDRLYVFWLEAWREFAILQMALKYPATAVIRFFVPTGGRLDSIATHFVTWMRL